MHRIGKLFATGSLAALLEMHPAPWHVARRRNLPLSGSECVDLRDALGQRIVELPSSTLADGIVAAINGAYLCGQDESESPVAPLLQIEPWRGQEASENHEEASPC